MLGKGGKTKAENKYKIADLFSRFLCLLYNEVQFIAILYLEGASTERVVNLLT